MAYFLAGVGALVAVLLLARGVVRADPKRLAENVRKIAGWTAIAAAVLATLRGGFVIAVPLAMMGMALLGRSLPFGLAFPGGNSNKSAGQQSRVRTAYLEMFLEHDTGSMDGRVMQGGYTGRALSELGLAELIDLWGECRAHDGQSRQLLEAYLDRRDPDWRATAGAGPAGEGTGAEAGHRHGGPMTVEEAHEVLGLAPGAGQDDIRRAHRTLMKKLHPDQGGSTYLAAKLNEAKDTLLRKGR